MVLGVMVVVDGDRLGIWIEDLRTVGVFISDRLLALRGPGRMLAIRRTAEIELLANPPYWTRQPLARQQAGQGHS